MNVGEGAKISFLSVREETFETLNLLRWKDEDDDFLLRRIVEYARCYMIIRGSEGPAEKLKTELELLEAIRDFVLSRRDDIEKDVENFGMLKPVLKHFLEEVKSK